MEILNLGDIEKQPEQLIEVARSFGCFQLLAPELFSDGEAVLRRAKQLFDLDESEKIAISKRKPTSYAGYSLLQNERDCREQTHIYANNDWRSPTPDTFGLASESMQTGCKGAGAPESKGETSGNDTDQCSLKLNHLKTPNQVSDSLGTEWTTEIDGYMQKVTDTGKLLLLQLGRALDLDPSFFSISSSSDSYHLLKLIHYLPLPDEVKRQSVPVHKDWSWITIVMQDSHPGLEVLDAEDKWHSIVRQDLCFVVVIGELLEVATGGYFRASPHRVVLEDPTMTRLSAPFFLCPDLTAEISCEGTPRVTSTDVHVHSMFAPETTFGDFHFGATERNRKVNGRWCYKPECCL